MGSSEPQTVTTTLPLAETTLQDGQENDGKEDKDGAEQEPVTTEAGWDEAEDGEAEANKSNGQFLAGVSVDVDIDTDLVTPQDGQENDGKEDKDGAEQEP